MSLTLEKCAGHIKFVIPQEMLCVLLKMYMKYEISGVAGHVQETYSVLDLEMCRTHQISDTGNVQEMSYFLSWKCTLNKGACQVTFPKYQIIQFLSRKFALNSLDISCSLSGQKICLIFQ